MNHPKLSTVNEVIGAFGGAAKMAETLDFTEAQIKMWKSRGRFSARSWAKIYAAAKERGICIEPELIGGFGSDKPSANPQPAEAAAE